MKSVFFQAIGGLALFLFGFIMGYMYLTGGRLPVFLLVSVPAVVAGIALFVMAVARRRVSPVPEEKKPSMDDASIIIDTTSQQSILERNNAIMNDWSKTYETREKMKMLKIAASAAEQEK